MERDGVRERVEVNFNELSVVSRSTLKAGVCTACKDDVGPGHSKEKKNLGKLKTSCQVCCLTVCKNHSVQVCCKFARGMVRKVGQT